MKHGMMPPLEGDMGNNRVLPVRRIVQHFGPTNTLDCQQNL